MNLSEISMHNYTIISLEIFIYIEKQFIRDQLNQY